MTKIKVLEDFSDWRTPAIEPGTVIEDALIDETTGEAWYFHPETAEDWLSFPGDYEVLPDGGK